MRLSTALPPGMDLPLPSLLLSWEPPFSSGLLSLPLPFTSLLLFWCQQNRELTSLYHYSLSLSMVFSLMISSINGSPRRGAGTQRGLARYSPCVLIKLFSQHRKRGHDHVHRQKRCPACGGPRQIGAS